MTPPQVCGICTIRGVVCLCHPVKLPFDYVPILTHSYFDSGSDPDDHPKINIVRKSRLRREVPTNPLKQEGQTNWWSRRLGQLQLLGAGSVMGIGDRSRAISNQEPQNRFMSTREPYQEPQNRIMSALQPGSAARTLALLLPPPGLTVSCSLKGLVSSQTCHLPPPMYPWQPWRPWRIAVENRPVAVAGTWR